MLEEGGAVRGEVIGVPDSGIHLGRVSMTTDGWRFPTDSDALVPRSSVQKIRLEKRRGLNRVAGSILGGAGAMFLSWLALAPAKLDLDSTRDANLFLTTSIGAAVGGAVLATGWANARIERPPSSRSSTDLRNFSIGDPTRIRANTHAPVRLSPPRSPTMISGESFGRQLLSPSPIEDGHCPRSPIIGEFGGGRERRPFLPPGSALWGQVDVHCRGLV